jgi:hypothetical protein
MKIGAIHTYKDDEGYKAVWSNCEGYHLIIQDFIDNNEPFVILEKKFSPFVSQTSLKVLTKSGIIGWMRSVDLSRLQEKTS